MPKGWYWRGNVAAYDFRIGETRYRGTLAITKDSGVDQNGKSPADRADAEVRRLRVDIEQNNTVEEIWKQTRRRLISNNIVKMDFNEIWDTYVKKGMSSAGTERMKLYASHLRAFCEWMTSHYSDIKDVSQVTADHAREYIADLRKAPGATATKNDKLTTLRAIFTCLGRSAGVIENPFCAPDIKKIHIQQIKRDIYTPAQIEILFSASGWMYELFVTAFATFQREEDCCLIKRSYIHLDRNRVIFPFTHKTGVSIELPMVPRFRKLAEAALEEDSGSEYLFPDLAEKYLKDSPSIGKAVKRFLESKGITGTMIDVEGYARKVSVLDVHSIRHTAAVLAVLRGWPLSMVMKATGHKTLKMLMRYIDHVSEEEKEKYFAQFDEAFQQKKSESPVIETEDPDNLRLKLANLAYTLPLETVQHLLQESQKLLPE